MCPPPRPRGLRHVLEVFPPAAPGLPTLKLYRAETDAVLGTRIIAFLVFMGIFSAAYQLGSMSEVSEEDAAIFMAEFEELVKGIDGPGIFFHNAAIALAMFLPGFGIAWGLFSATATGYAFAAIVTYSPELAGMPPLAILYLTPFGLMELAAYSTAISRSYILLSALIKRTGLYQHIRPTGIEIGIVLGLLLAGGFLEYHMIRLAEEGGFEMPGL